jgi:serine/threonine-protein kinase
MAQYPRAYRFGEFRVDVAQRRLATLDDATVPLSGRAFDVLTYLLEHRSRIVAKDELMAAVWPGLYVEPNNLSQAISALRRALGDTRDSPRYVATVAGRGFQCVADVVVERVAGVPGSLAVLPMKAITPARADPALELGVTETMIGRLSTITGLRVHPLASVQRYATVDPVHAGRALRADVVLDGRLQAERGRVRLTARLIEPVHGTSLWAGAVDVSASDVLSAQDALADRVVAEIRPELSEAERRRLSRRPTHDDEAWLLYLNGRYHWDQKTAEGNRLAADAFTAAIARDREFALAYAGLADVHAVRAIFGVAPARAALEQARQAARRATELDPGLADAQASLGHVLTQLDHDWDAGERQQELALSLNPAHAQAMAWRAMLHTYRGRHDDAQAWMRRAQEFGPMSLSFAALAEMLRYFAGDVAGAARKLRRLLDAAPDAPLTRHLLARALLASGAATEALALVENRDAPGPGSFSNLGRALALVGRRDEARAEVAKLERLAAEGFGVGFDLALVHLALGDEDAALDWLDRSVDDGSQMIGYLESEPALEPIRRHRRVRAIVVRLGLA